MFICIFYVLLVYFGKDIISKSRPITRLSEQYIEFSKVNLEDIPFAIKFVDRQGAQIKNIEKYVKFNPMMYYLSMDKQTGKQITTLTNLFMNKCLDLKLKDKIKHVFNEKSVPMGESICLNPSKEQYMNGTIIENSSPYIMIEYASPVSSFFYIYFTECSGSECASKEEMNKVLNEFYIIIYFFDNYINLNNNKEPAQPFLNSMTKSLSNKLQKQIFFKFTNTFISTDSGFMMEDISIQNITQLKEMTNDIYNTDVGEFFRLYFESPRFSNYHNRRYVKIQDIIANVGGLIKFLILIGTGLSVIH